MSIQKISKGIYLGTEVGFSFDSMKIASSFQPVSKPTNIPVDTSLVETSSAKGKKIVSWGSGNTGPKKMLEQLNKIGSAGKALEISSDAHFGTGLSVYKETDDGKKQTIPFRMHPKLAAFDKDNNWNLFYAETIPDYECHEMMPVEFCLTNNYLEFSYIKRHDPNHFRYEEMNLNTGRIDNAYLNADWENYKDNVTHIIPLFTQYDTAEYIKEECKRRKLTRIMICYHAAKNGELYYNLPRWQAPFRNGWADIILAVPEIKKRITEQQLNIKFLIHVSDDYFRATYGKNEKQEFVWDTMKEEEREAEYNDLIDTIDDHLSGIKASGRSLTVPMIKNAFDQKSIKSVEIERIDSETKDGALLAEAAAGHQEFFIAKGVDPCLPGASIPGTAYQSGSGSNKREAYTILCASKVRPRTITLLPFYLVRDYNDWGDDLYGAFPNVVLTTLDKETSGQTEVTN